MVYLDYNTAAVPKSLPNPPGFGQFGRDGKSRPEATKSVANATELKLKRAWEVSFAPAKQLPMQAIMLYFSGSGVQIFSLGTIFMLVTGPIGALLGILRTFEPFRTPRAGGDLTYALLFPPMLVFVLCNLATFALGLYKCWTMGILPSGAADWLQFETRGVAPEWSAVRSLLLG